MKTLVKIKVPLSGDISIKDEFQIQPPCFYCEAQVDEKVEHFWTYTAKYPIQTWGKIGLQTMRDTNGDGFFGNYVLKLPYCQAHVSPNKTFSSVDKIPFVVGPIVGLALMVLGYVLDKTFRPGWQIAILGFGGYMFLSIVFFYIVINKLIKPLISKSNPALRDYVSIDGHYGIQIDNIRTDGGETGIGPIRYYLSIKFASVKLAQRFISAYPQSIITKGEKLIE